MSAATRDQNERVFRGANEAVNRHRNAASPRLFVFLCECSDVDCRHGVELTQDEYATIRGKRDRFVLATGHEDPDERVLDEFDRYTVIEKSPA